MNIHKRTSDFAQGEDDRGFAASLVNLDAYALQPFEVWEAAVVEAAYKLGLLAGSGYVVPFTAERTWTIALTRRISFQRDLPDHRALFEKCRIEFERGQAEGKQRPANAVHAFPEPDRSLFRSAGSVAKIRASILPEPFFRLVEQQTRNTGLPTNYLVMAWLTACAGLIGTSREISPAPHSWSEPPILWTALVGEPSDMKSPSIDLSQKLVEEIDAELHPINAKKLEEFAQELTRYSAEQKAYEAEIKNAGRTMGSTSEPPIKPKRPALERLLVGNVTPEKLIALFADNPRGLLGIYDELPAFWKTFNTYNQGDGRQLALKAYGGRSGTLDRVKMDEPLLAERCALSILGGVQTDVLNKVIERDENDGFFARFLYVWPSVHPLRLQGKDLRLDPVRNAMRRLRKLDFENERSKVLYLADECRADFESFRIEWLNHARLKGTGLNGWVAKGPGTVLRIALALEFMAWAGEPNAPEPKSVSRESFAKARLLWEDALYYHAERAFGFERTTEADEGARKLALHLAESGEPRVNASEVRERRLPGLRVSAEVQAAFARLVDAGIVFPDANREGGQQPAGAAQAGRGWITL